MKFNLIVIIFIINIFSAFNQEEDSFTTEFLKNSIWTGAGSPYVFDLEFLNDSVFQLIYSIERDNYGEKDSDSYSNDKHLESVPGKYRIENNLLILESNTFFFTNDKPINGFLLTNEKLRLFKDTTYLFYNFRISNDNGYQFWSKNYTAAEGSIRKNEGDNVVTLQPHVAEIIAECYLKDRPGDSCENHEIIEFKNNIIAKGYNLTILGRTEEKKNIKGMSDYWYFCKIDIGSTSYFRGWVHGSYIKF